MKAATTTALGEEVVGWYWHKVGSFLTLGGGTCDQETEKEVFFFLLFFSIILKSHFT